MASLSPRLRHNLDEQGFTDLDDAAKARYALALRFTPAVGSTIVAVGLLRRSARVMAVMSVVTLTGALFPRGMLLDRVYNVALRHLTRTPPLPPVPTPRRFSYALSTALLAASARGYARRRPLWGFLWGSPVAFWGGVLTTRLWCIGSAIYHALFDRAVAKRA